MSESAPLPDPITTPLSSPAASAWNVANALTVLRILLVPVYGWLLLVDGDLARARNLITNFGKIADPIADKALMGMAFVGLSVLGDVPWWVTAVVLVREWGITVMRLFVIRHGVMPAGRGGKVKTALQSLGLTLFTLPLWTLPGQDLWWSAASVILGLAVLVTVATGLDIALKALRLRRTSERAQRKRAARAARAAARSR